MRRAVVDTNVLIAYLFEDDVHHNKARGLLSGYEQWIIPMIVIHELVWFFRHHEINLTVIKDILALPEVEVVENVVGDVLYAISRAEHPYDYNDLVIYATALRLGVPFLSFDEEFLSRYVSP